MGDRCSRRAFLTSSAAATLVGFGGCSSLTGSRTTNRSDGTNRGDATANSPAETALSIDQTELEPLDVRGAIYIPARAFNFYQQWADYDPDVVERDLGYASRVNLNAIRTWTSLEAWREEPETLRKNVEHFLSTADDNGQQVLLGLFDFAGKEPTKQRLNDTDPRSATGVREPSSKIMRNKQRWDEPREYVRWFMDHFGDDDRLLAIEIMNEPGWRSYVQQFARGMYGTADERQGDVALTVGSTSMANNSTYADWGVDAFQFHYNFAESPGVYEDMLRSNRDIADDVDVPVWLSEWQRVRHATGFASEPPEDQKSSNYSSLAPLIHEAGFGNFFWSLMVKPAFVPAQRKHGVLNGLFHEDGAVWSLDDARSIKAMSGDPSFDGTQRQKWPEWASSVKDGT
ncbi:glycoside hydrolase family 5 protein [Halorussus sp. MSC15.2]|uniref:glycoside hydrolase family 5 protein n=1 Tax=Halorussus sp. MSC15.2 TaxID=2283638 RepID=UPI001F077920|nr:glycoside hydrolase family 5 protein [Halorussus sp. MSC15.2]